MNGKENIINKILSDADACSAAIVANAQSRAEELIAAAKQSVEVSKAALDARIAASSQEKLHNACANAELEGKKYRLFVRRQLITRCYEQAHKQLAQMNAEERLDFLGELISKFAEDGEKVYVTKADAPNVTPMWLKGFEKHLVLGDKYIRADGGLVLEGNGYEKDLTLGSVLRYLREQTEGKVAAILGVCNE